MLFIIGLTVGFTVGYLCGWEPTIQTNGGYSPEGKGSGLGVPPKDE